jgi:hypothetical protein
MTNKPQPPRLLISASHARRVLDVGNTKFWELVREGKIEMTSNLGRRAVLYSSLERLARPLAE